MACTYCTHWNEKERLADVNDIVGMIASSKGECTISPTWMETTGLHYCGQFKPKDAGLLAHCWQSMHRNYKRASEEKSKRIEAEKKLKEIRKRLREPKSSTFNSPLHTGMSKLDEIIGGVRHENN